MSTCSYILRPLMTGFGTPDICCPIGCLYQTFYDVYIEGEPLRELQNYQNHALDHPTEPCNLLESVISLQTGEYTRPPDPQVINS